MMARGYGFNFPAGMEVVMENYKNLKKHIRVGSWLASGAGLSRVREISSQGVTLENTYIEVRLDGDRYLLKNDTEVNEKLNLWIDCCLPETEFFDWYNFRRRSAALLAVAALKNPRYAALAEINAWGFSPERLGNNEVVVYKNKPYYLARYRNYSPRIGEGKIQLSPAIGRLEVKKYPVFDETDSPTGEYNEREEVLGGRDVAVSLKNFFKHARLVSACMVSL